MNKKTISLAVTMALLLGSMAVAAEGRTHKGSDDRERRGPPQQAIDACAELAVDDACVFVGRRDREVQGVCTVLRDDSFACKPEKRRGHDRKGGRGEQAAESESL